MIQKNSKKFFTTTLPYPNSDLHLGHVFENVCMDVRVRFERLRGYEVIYNTGVDEHGTKIQQEAHIRGIEPQMFVDKMSKQFLETLKTIDIYPTLFTRTTSDTHKKGAIAFWEICKKNGFIYKGSHEGMYCVGCEFFIPEKDISPDNTCPIHSNKKLEFIQEENYFFKMSACGEALATHYKNTPDAVIPSTRMNEIVSFLKGGLEDIAISRNVSRVSWGIPVPHDPKQVMYVWFDALTNYITTIGWPENDEWSEWWPVIQSAGKDNLKPQCIIWQSMLYAAGLPFSKQIYIHGNINDGQGRKMSKSLGNGITPAEIIERYGTETLRFLMIGYVHPFEDTAFSWEGVHAIYNDDLVNGVGNVVARTLTLAQKHIARPDTHPDIKFPETYSAGLEAFDFRAVAQCIRDAIRKIDEHITTTKPFTTIKSNPIQAKKDITIARDHLIHLAHLLTPVIPATAEKIHTAIRTNTPPTPPLFPRK